MLRVPVSAAARLALECAFPLEAEPSCEDEALLFKVLVRDGDRWALSFSAEQRDALFSMLTAEANGADERAGDRSLDADARGFARRDCRALGALASRVLRVGS